MQDIDAYGAPMRIDQLIFRIGVVEGKRGKYEDIDNQKDPEY